jgi:hypothetical protein
VDGPDEQTLVTAWVEWEAATECRIRPKGGPVGSPRMGRLNVPFASDAIAEHLGLETVVDLRKRIAGAESRTGSIAAFAGHGDLRVRLREVVSWEEHGDAAL